MKKQIFALTLATSIILLASGCKEWFIEHAGPSFLAKIETLNPSEKDFYPAIVIGSGPGGLTSATNLSLAGVDTLIITGEQPGGRLATVPEIINWPGELRANGAELANKFYNQALQNGAFSADEIVSEFDFSKWPYEIKTLSKKDGTKRLYKTPCLIIDSGAIPKKLEVSGEDLYRGKGISQCAFCEGALYKNSEVIVIGSGNSAFVQAEYLAGIASTVTLLVKENEMKISKADQDYLSKKQNVEILFNSEIVKFNGNGQQLTGVSIRNNSDKSIKNIDTDAAFIAIGSNPRTTHLKGKLALDANGYILVSNKQETSVPGVFAIGAATSIPTCEKHLIKSVAQGYSAAIEVTKILNRTKFFSEKYIPKSSGSLPKSNIREENVEQTQQSQGYANSSKWGPVGKVIDIKDEFHFSQLLRQTELPVVIDFFATWCPPCQRMHPVFEKVAEKFAGEVLFAKVDVDKHKAISTSSKIQAMPTFLFFKNSPNGCYEVLREQGGMSEQEIAEAVRKHLLL